MYRKAIENVPGNAPRDCLVQSPKHDVVEVYVKAIVKLCYIMVLSSMTLVSLAARAEIEKTVAPCDTGSCVYLWPKLPQIKGWHQDKNQSFNSGISAWAPNGHSFVTADVVIYAIATYKPTVPETKNLVNFIAADTSRFIISDPTISINEVSELVTGDGQKLRSFTFLPESKGSWEVVSYGEEGNYYLTFVLSARSKEGFEKAQAAYHQLIAGYRAKSRQTSSQNKTALNLRNPS